MTIMATTDALRLPIITEGPSGWDLMYRFLSARAVTGLERADEGVYHRRWEGNPVAISSPPPEPDEGTAGFDHELSVDTGLMVQSTVVLSAHDQARLAARVADLTDALSDRTAIAHHLAADPDLQTVMAGLPDGLPPRLPGCWNRFEIVVRAIVGQQVSVAGARTTMTKLLCLVTQRNLDPDSTILPAFPTATAIAEADLNQLAMADRKRRCLRLAAQAIASGAIDLSPGVNSDEVGEALLAIPGIGPWTVGYILMRAFRRADCWPLNDLVLRQRLGVDNAELARRARIWHPYNAYGALSLWAAPTR